MASLNQAVNPSFCCQLPVVQCHDHYWLRISRSKELNGKGIFRDCSLCCFSSDEQQTDAQDTDVTSGWPSPFFHSITRSFSTCLHITSYLFKPALKLLYISCQHDVCVSSLRNHPCICFGCSTIFFQLWRRRWWQQCCSPGSDFGACCNGISLQAINRESRENQRATGGNFWQNE